MDSYPRHNFQDQRSHVVLLHLQLSMLLGASSSLLLRDSIHRPDELERIQAVGGRGFFWDAARVFSVLAMSRAIGDSYLKPFVISDHKVRVLERKGGEDDFLILASDGLWDVVPNEVACNVVRACLRSSARPHEERSSPTSNLSPRQSSGSDSSGDDEAPNDGSSMLSWTWLHWLVPNISVSAILII